MEFSIVPFSVYEQIFKKKKPLKPTTVRLKSFSNEIMEPKGTLSVTVDWLGKTLWAKIGFICMTGQDWYM